MVTVRLVRSRRPGSAAFYGLLPPGHPCHHYAVQMERSSHLAPALIISAVLSGLLFGLRVLQVDSIWTALIWAGAGAFPWIGVLVLRPSPRSFSEASDFLFLTAAALTCTAMAALVVMNLWAGVCWDCGVQPYHDPPTRGFVATIWGLWIWLGLCATVGALALLSFASRLLAALRGQW